MPNCLAYSATNRCQPANFIASAPAMREIGCPASSRSRTSKEMCQPAAPQAMKWRSILCHNVKRVPPPEGSSSQRMSPYSRKPGASARVTVVSIGIGFPTHVSLTVAPTVPRFPSTTNGAHSRSWRTRISVHLSPSFRTCAPLAGPGVYCSRFVIWFSLARPAHQLSELNKVAASVLQHGDGRAGHSGGRHGELGAVRLDALVIAVDVVGEEHGRGLVLLQQ